MHIAQLAATLSTVGDELGGDHAHRHAVAACFAHRPISELTATPEPGADQLTVSLAIDKMRRSGDLRTCLPIRQIAARIIGGQIKLDALKRRLSRVHQNTMA